MIAQLRLAKLAVLLVVMLTVAVLRFKKRLDQNARLGSPTPGDRMDENAQLERATRFRELHTQGTFVAAGVRRVSLATSLYRAAMTALIAAAREIRDAGTFSYVERSVSSSEFAGYLKDSPR